MNLDESGESRTRRACQDKQYRKNKLPKIAENSDYTYFNSQSSLDEYCWTNAIPILFLRPILQVR